MAATETTAPEVEDREPVARSNVAGLFSDPARCAADWHAWVAQAGLAGPAGELARNAVLQGIDGGAWTLALRRELLSIAVEPMTTRLQTLLQEQVGTPVRLNFVAAEASQDTPAARREQASRKRQGEAEQAIADDPLVQQMETELGARVVPQSIRAL